MPNCWLPPRGPSLNSARGPRATDKGVVLGIAASTGLFVEQMTRHTLGRKRFIPTFKVEAVDSVAAGDCVNGGLAVALPRGAGLTTH